MILHIDLSLSPSQDGPLDLRMNFKAGIPAWKWLQTTNSGELASVIYENGEARAAVAAPWETHTANANGECQDDDPVMCHRSAEAALERQRRLGASARSGHQWISVAVPSGKQT